MNPSREHLSRQPGPGDSSGRSSQRGDAIALASTPGPGPWVTHARCRDSAWQVFFPRRGQDLDPARAICALCSVIDPCRQYAIPISELHGVWGGLSENQRRRARKARATAANPPAPAATPPTPAVETRPEAQTARKRAPAGNLQAALTELSRRPGRWVVVGRYQSPGSASSTASLLRHGRRPIPAGCWEFEARRDDHGGSEVWARFAPLPAQLDHLHAVGQ
jgi:WhiB family redox-sensing transcriptional regulator